MLKFLTSSLISLIISLIIGTIEIVFITGYSKDAAGNKSFVPGKERLKRVGVLFIPAVIFVLCGVIMYGVQNIERLPNLFESLISLAAIVIYSKGYKEGNTRKAVSIILIISLIASPVLLAIFKPLTVKNKDLSESTTFTPFESTDRSKENESYSYIEETTAEQTTEPVKEVNNNFYDHIASMSDEEAEVFKNNCVEKSIGNIEDTAAAYMTPTINSGDTIWMEIYPEDLQEGDIIMIGVANEDQTGGMVCRIGSIDSDGDMICTVDSKSAPYNKINKILTEDDVMARIWLER